MKLTLFLLLLLALIGHYYATRPLMGPTKSEIIGHYPPLDKRVPARLKHKALQKLKSIKADAGH